MQNLVVCHDAGRDRWQVIEVGTNGFFCKVFCETDTKAKAILLANVVNDYFERNHERLRRDPTEQRDPGG